MEAVPVDNFLNGYVDDRHGSILGVCSGVIREHWRSRESLDSAQYDSRGTLHSALTAKRISTMDDFRRCGLVPCVPGGSYVVMAREPGLCQEAMSVVAALANGRNVRVRSGLKCEMVGEHNVGCCRDEHGIAFGWSWAADLAVRDSGST
jgi:hypothetical protein